jgi:xylulose-5-phosphate/fructose-6-phosphate phosphoketolase
VYVHLNRLIVRDGLNMIFLAGPGHGAPGVLGQVYLEGAYSEIYTDKSEDAIGLKDFFRQFSFPGVSAATALPRPQARFMRGANSDMCFLMLVARPSTVPT